jgi:hypothetical protein
VQQGLQNASPDASKAVNQTMDQLVPMLDQLDDKTLDGLLQLIQYLMDHEQDYERLVAQLVQEGNFQAGTFPEHYDPEFLSTFGMMIMHAKQARKGGEEPAPEMTPPANMARGGIAEAARAVARQGRGNDTMLAHITPREAHILRAHGGMGTRNPSTGMLEFDFWDDLRKPFKAVGDFVGDVVKGVGNVVKDIVSSPIGKVLGTIALATFLGPAGMGVANAMWAPALASGAVTLLGGGSITDALISGATAYFGAPGGVVSNFVGSFGGVMLNPAVNAALSAGLVGTGAGLLQGKSLADSVKNGLVAGAIGGGMAMLPSFGGGNTTPKAGTPASDAGLTTGGAETPPGITETGVIKAPTEVNSLVQSQYPAQGQGAPAGNIPAPIDPGAPVGLPTATENAQLPAMDQIAKADSNFVSALKGPTPGPSSLPAQYDSKAIQNAMVEGQQPDFAAPAKTGVIKGAANDLMNQAKGFYDEQIKPYTPSGVKEAGMEAAEKAGKSALDRLPADAPDALKTAAYQKAYDAAMPGMLQTYGPLAAAGIAGLALTGGFDVKQPELTAEQQAMQDDMAAYRAEIKANPGKWYNKNLKGVTYDKNGVITGSTPYDPSIGLPSSLVAPTQRQSYLPTTYTTPSPLGGAGSSGQQSYNTPAGSIDLSKYLYKPPAKKAMGGGIGSLGTGGYPRKTGAIAGPGTATSDSIPAMLSDGEFVMTAKAVRGAGKGSRLAGAKKMYALMHQLERNASRS